MTMTTAMLQPLLVELFVEELPPKALKKLGQDFARLLTDGLKAQGLVDAQAQPEAFASPRRLGLLLPAVRGQAPEQTQRLKLMPVSVGLDANGQATPALVKKLASLGAEDTPVRQLQRAADGKNEALFLDRVLPGATLASGLQQALSDAISQLPIPKVMQYPQPAPAGSAASSVPGGEGGDRGAAGDTAFQPGWTRVQFVRPAHGLVALHGAVVVPVSALGLQAGRTTRGHRFEARQPQITLRDANSYAGQLRDEGAVIASFEERRAEMLRQLNLAAQAEGLQVTEDEALVDEVTALVERPQVMLCRFEPEYLAVPQECLILTMKANQKYFPLLDAQGKLSERFLIVSNIQPADPSRVIQGNERVIRPRLADAKFFFDQDRKQTLLSRLPRLDKVVYHGKLGNQGERVARVRAIAASIAHSLAAAQPQLSLSGAAPGSAAGPSSTAQPPAAEMIAHADRAAMLAKADLLSLMVGEFPELQGVMGAYYARHDGEPETVAQAIEDHYKPRFAGDELPRGTAGLVVALADKLETLAGLFSIGQLPTGDKDPFALRRHALGVIRILVERQLPLAVPDLVQAAFSAFSASAASSGSAASAANSPEAAEALISFFYDRLVGYLRELGYSAHEVDAVVALRPSSWAELPQRLAAVREFALMQQAPALASANKRVGNILKKAEGPVATEVQAQLLQEPAEKALALALADTTPLANAAFDRGDYSAHLKALADLKGPVDEFFEVVMVNADDPALRNNRLALLRSLQQAMNRVADLSRLAH